jgi:biotin carboxyl carrier protein
MVVSIKIKLNQDVRMGDPLLILEAMKMENELRCPVNGKIQKVFVKMGKKVEKGEELVVISK